MSDVINLDFLKLTDTKTEKKGSNKSIPNLVSKDKNNNVKAAFQINNIIIGEEENLKSDNISSNITFKKEGLEEEKSLEDTNIPFFNVPENNSNLKTTQLNNSNSLPKENPELQTSYTKSKDILENKKNIKNNPPTLLVNGDNILNKKQDHSKNNIALNSSNHYLKDNKRNKQSNLGNIFSSIKEKNKKKFTSLFKNYINFSNKKKLRNKASMVKIITSNQLITSHTPQKANEKLSELNFQNTSKPEIIEQDKTTLKSNNQSKTNEVNFDIKNVVKKEEANINNKQNIDTLENFDRLKNILDIKNNDISSRMADILERNIKNGNTKFEIQIKPENLGKIDINVEMNGDSIDLNLRTDNSQAIQILSENSSNLQKMMQNHGLTLSNFNLNQNNNKKNNSNNKDNQLKSVDEKEVDNENKIKKNEGINTGNLVYIKA